MRIGKKEGPQRLLCASLTLFETSSILIVLESPLPHCARQRTTLDLIRERDRRGDIMQGRLARSRRQGIKLGSLGSPIQWTIQCCIALVPLCTPSSHLMTIFLLSLPTVLCANPFPGRSYHLEQALFISSPH